MWKLKFHPTPPTLYGRNSFEYLISNVCLIKTKAICNKEIAKIPVTTWTSGDLFMCTYVCIGYNPIWDIIIIIHLDLVQRIFWSLSIFYKDLCSCLGNNKWQVNYGDRRSLGLLSWKEDTTSVQIILMFSGGLFSDWFLTPRWRTQDKLDGFWLTVFDGSCRCTCCLLFREKHTTLEMLQRQEVPLPFPSNRETYTKPWFWLDNTS